MLSWALGPVRDPDAFRAHWDRCVASLDGTAGWLSAVGGVTSHGQGVVVVRFASEAEAGCCPDLAGTDAGQLALHDSPDVEAMLEGTPPRASFVQLMTARVRDRRAFAALDRPGVTRFAEVRPDFIGTLHVWEGDDRLTVIDSYTSEAAARAGEATPLPPDVQALVDAWFAQLSDVAWYDLPSPWHAAPSP